MSDPSQNAEDIFCSALERPGLAEREAYLGRACRGDAALEARVRRLLALHEIGEGEGFLEGGVFEALAMGAEDEAAQVGPYKLLQKIGEGGFGTVWMAEQLEPVRRRVALKIVKLGMDTREVVARFEQERQSLAMMDHPNIARVYDAGATPSGRPYFVMELVRGVPVTVYCDAHRLSLEARLKLFMQICHALQHAHQKGVIHRDLKPSNILVAAGDDGEPAPKVIDFGVAKAVDRALTHRTLFTRFEQMIGTPAYMSPEQAGSGPLDVDTRSDIYALGVVLYELLTGAPPFDPKELVSAGYDAMRQVIREREPPKPSTRVGALGKAELTTVAQRRHMEPPRLAARVRGDLDWIVMKALEKDRNRRYETANAFALDIQRHLQSEAVSARPASYRYQIQKFLRRRRGPAVGAAAVLLALLAGTAVSTWQAVRARTAEASVAAELAAKGTALRQVESARAEALVARERARRAVDEMYTQFAEKILARTPRMEPLQQEFLEKALAYYEQFAAETTVEPEARREAAEAARRVGEIRVKLGNYAEAEEAYLRSVELLEVEETAGGIAMEAGQAALAQSLHGLGSLFRTVGRTEEAEESVRRAVVLREALAAMPGEDGEAARVERMESRNLLALILFDRGLPAEAEAIYRRSLEEGEASGEPQMNELRRRYVLARLPLLVNFAAVLQKRGRMEEAESRLREALSLTDGLVVGAPQDPMYRAAGRNVRNNLGAFLMEVARFEEAGQHFRASEEESRRLSGDFPLVPDYRMDTMTARANAALVLSRQGRDADAETELQDVFAELKALAEEFRDNPDYTEALADECHNLGAVLKDRGRTNEAERFYRESLDLKAALETRFPGWPRVRKGLASTWFNLGLLYGATGREEEAFQAFGDAIEAAENVLETAPDSIEHVYIMGAALTEQAGVMREVRRRPEEALELLERAAGLLERCVEANPRREDFRTARATAGRVRADALQDLGLLQEAESAFRETIAESRSIVADFPGAAAHWHRLGEDLCGMTHAFEEDPARRDEAVGLVSEALSLQEKVLGTRPGEGLNRRARESLAHHCETLANLLLDKGEREPAMDMHRRALALSRELIAEAPGSKGLWCSLGGGLNNFAMGFLRRGDPAAAVVPLREAVEAQREALKIDAAYERSRWFLRNHFMNLGQAYWGLEDRAAAKDAYGNAVAAGEGLVRDFPETLLHRRNLVMDRSALSVLALETGAVAESLGEKEAAIELVEEMVGPGGEEGDPADREKLADLQQELARLYALGPDRELRDPGKAVELATAAVRNAPTHTTAWHALGLAHCLQDRPEEAILAVDKSIELTGGGDALNWFVRAMARFQLGDEEGAMRDFGRAEDWLEQDFSRPYRELAVPYRAAAAQWLRLEQEGGGPWRSMAEREPAGGTEGESPPRRSTSENR